MISITGFLSTTGSSIFVPAIGVIETEFNERNREVVVLATALYVLGLGFGPFVFAPISELNGRQRAYVISMIGELQSDIRWPAKSVADRQNMDRIHIPKSWLCFCAKVSSSLSFIR